jgi:hypothetical protein
MIKMVSSSSLETPVLSLIDVVFYFRTLISSSYCCENFTSHIFDLYTWPETVVSTERMLDS